MQTKPDRWNSRDWNAIEIITHRELENGEWVEFGDWLHENMKDDYFQFDYNTYAFIDPNDAEFFKLVWG
jgi:PKD repeat protein